MFFSGFINADIVKTRIAVLLIAAAVDLLVGDPLWLWHPVQGMGALINASESFFRKIFRAPWKRDKEERINSGKKSDDENRLNNEQRSNDGYISTKDVNGSDDIQALKNIEKKETKKEADVESGIIDKSIRWRERLAGACMVFTVLFLTMGFYFLLIRFCRLVHPWLSIAAEGILCGRLLALRSLGEAGRSVRDPLRSGDLEGARRAVSMIVGRDTERLDKEGIVKAAVETVAENTSDGITAPLFYMVLSGGAGGVFYKAVNTMDSMTGYRNRRYRYFGTAAARLDDVLNFIPSRLTALFMILACLLPVSAKDRSADRAPDGKNAFRIWIRDRGRSPSPNSAQTESVCAGALHIRLLGDTWYFGKLHHKQEIGDGKRPVETEDITRAVGLMNKTCGLMYCVSICVLLLIVMLSASGCAGADGRAEQQSGNKSAGSVRESQPGNKAAGSVRESQPGNKAAENVEESLSGDRKEISDARAVDQEKTNTTGRSLPGPGTYEPIEFTVRGGTGKVTITCPEVTVTAAEKWPAEALLVLDSPHYEWVKAGGIKYEPVNSDDSDRKTSEFRIPVLLEEEMEIIGLTTAMSEPHEITYTILISLTKKDEEAHTGKEEGEYEENNSDIGLKDESQKSEYTRVDPPKIPGLTFISSMDLSYARAFDIYFYQASGNDSRDLKGAAAGDTQYILIDIHESASYLLVPEGKEVPEGISKEIIVLRAPVQNIYAAATSSVALFNACGALDQIMFTGTDAGGWYIDPPKEALRDGRMVYAGKYSSPDYELLAASGCGLAVESTMILHAPEVKEKLEELGIPVLIDTSSTESHPLGRTEWVRLYGALTGHREEADAFFARQARKLQGMAGISKTPDMTPADSDVLLNEENAEEKVKVKDNLYEDTGKTVAFFSVTSTGNIIVRASDDYIPGMISLAGGKYVFKDLVNTSGSSASVRMSMETFYSEAKDADYLIYNSTIESPLRSLAELTAKSGLFADFKAFQEENVWQIRRSLYQSPDIAVDMIYDINKMLCGGAQDDMVFLEKVGP